METKKQEKVDGDVKYVDMSIEQLEKEIKEEKEWVKKLGVSEYDLKHIEEEKKSIKKQEERIAEKKTEYLVSIKINKDNIKESKKVIKDREQKIKTDEDFKKRRELHITVIQNIKASLTKDPNYYKDDIGGQKAPQHSKEVA